MAIVLTMATILTMLTAHRSASSLLTNALENGIEASGGLTLALPLTPPLPLPLALTLALSLSLAVPRRATAASGWSRSYRGCSSRSPVSSKE